MKIKSSYIYIVMSQLLKRKEPKDENPYAALALDDTDTSSTDPDMPPLLENYAKDDDTTQDESEYHDAREGTQKLKTLEEIIDEMKKEAKEKTPPRTALRKKKRDRKQRGAETLCAALRRVWAEGEHTETAPPR